MLTFRPFSDSIKVKMFRVKDIFVPIPSSLAPDTNVGRLSSLTEPQFPHVT